MRLCIQAWLQTITANGPRQIGLQLNTVWLESFTLAYYRCHTILQDLDGYFALHCCDVIMGAMASQITSPTIVYSTVYLGADQRKHQSSASLAFVSGIHRWSVNSPHKWPVARKMFPFDDVIMINDTKPSNAENVSIWRRHHDKWYKATAGTELTTMLDMIFRWFSTRLQHLHCVSNGDTCTKRSTWYSWSMISNTTFADIVETVRWNSIATLTEIFA